MVTPSGCKDIGIKNLNCGKESNPLDNIKSMVYTLSFLLLLKIEDVD